MRGIPPNDTSPARPTQATAAGSHTGSRPGPRTAAIAAAFAMPLIGCLSQIQGNPSWRSDTAVLAALESPIELSGTLSAILSRAALWLPLGSHGFRLALPGAIAAGIAGISVLFLAHFLFQKQGGHSRLDPWLALGASIGVTFSFPWISEATISGGGAMGAALGLWLIVATQNHGLPRTLVGAVFGGVALGALFSESLWCGFLVCVTALSVWPEFSALRQRSRENLWNRQTVRISLLTMSSLASVIALWFPTLMGRSAQAWVSASSEVSHWPAHHILDWVSGIGFLWAGGAVVAVLFALTDRRPLYALVVAIFADFLLPGHNKLGWTESIASDQNRMALHLIALGGLTPLGALGLRTLGETAQALRLFAARPLAAMVAVLAIAGCLATAEDSLRTLDRTGTLATQSFTDEALQRLPDRALVITQSPAWGKRLLAAQAQGERPDVLVVPLSDLTRAQALSDWLKREPALELLLRDLAVNQTPSERSITRLVDERPVYLEATATWDRRLLEHVLPTLPLAAFSSPALGRSDRLAALESVVGPVSRIEKNIAEGLTPDAATAQILRVGINLTAVMLEEIHDTSAAGRLRELLPEEKANPVIEAAQLSPLAKL